MDQSELAKPSNLNDADKPYSRALTPKQLAFIAAYDGNGTESARRAGYEGDEATLAVTASRLLNNAKIVSAIHERLQVACTGLIATREELQALWTMLANDPLLEPKDRIKSSELLAKSHAMFVDKHEHSGPDGKPIALTASMSEEQIDARIKALEDKRKAALTLKEES